MVFYRPLWYRAKAVKYWYEPNVNMTQDETRIAKARWIAALLSVAGLGLSFVALEQHVAYVGGFATGPSFCNINAHFNCEAVNASEWSAVFGIPVASYGLFFYAALFIGALLSRINGFLPPRAWSSITLLLSAFASILSIVLFAISEVFIGSLCLMCIGLYIVNFSLFAVAWRSGWRGALFQGLKTGIKEAITYTGIAFGIVRGPGWRVRGTALILALCAAISVALPTLVFQRLLAQQEKSQDPVTAWERSPVVAFSNDVRGGAFSDYYHGELAAPIQIVEFADYECPACRHMYSALHDLLKRYEGKYLFVFRNYPLDKSCNPSMQRELHQFACTAAFFSRCAGEQGKFWESMELLFSKDAEKGELSTQALTDVASQQLSLDKEGIVECMQSQRYLKKIQQDIAAGNAAGLMGTPSIWVNGKYVAQPSPSNLEKIFSVVLERAGQ